MFRPLARAGSCRDHIRRSSLQTRSENPPTP
jgi:hypothetical protein